MLEQYFPFFLRLRLKFWDYFAWKTSLYIAVGFCFEISLEAWDFRQINFEHSIHRAHHDGNSKVLPCRGTSVVEFICRTQKSYDFSKQVFNFKFKIFWRNISNILFKNFLRNFAMQLWEKCQNYIYQKCRRNV